VAMPVEEQATRAPASGEPPVESDERDLAAARGGEIAAFNRLVLRYQDAVYTLCLRLLGNTDAAADAAQEAFLSAYRHLGELRGTSFRSWLFRIAANCCYDERRRRQRRPTSPLDLPGTHDEPGAREPADPAPGPEAAVLQGELERVVQAGLLTLPEDQRLAVVLCDLYEFDYHSIAVATGVEIGTVKSRINRGRRRLRVDLLAQRELLPERYRLIEKGS
jgi:RNA polymerase sigma-70 factor (ECF subfamily)